MKMKYDLIFSGLFFVVLMLLFISASITITVNSGLSSADDGFFALSSKSFSMGTYGLPSSSNEVIRFDPSVGSGPVLIGLGALATLIFGPQDSLGLLVLSLFILQFGLVLALLRRRFALPAVLSCGFMSLFLLILASCHQWYFGTFIGEVPALGFLLLGAALLSSGEKHLWQVLAGLSFAMAFLTKQITLFATFGIILIWFISIVLQKGTGRGFVALASLLSYLALPLFFWESFKLASLGLGSYRDLWYRTILETEKMAIGGGGDRVERFLSVLTDVYGPVTIVIVSMIGFAAVFALKNYKKNDIYIYPLMLCSGAFFYFVYIVTFSTLWPRYFFIGIGLLSFVCGAIVLFLGLRMRWIVICLLVSIVGMNIYRNVYGIVQWSLTSELSNVRHEVLTIIGNHPELPVAARSWHSFYDIAYLMNVDRNWVVESNSLNEILDHKFIAVLNSAFECENSFSNVVTRECEVILSKNRYAVYSCGNAFWAAYSAKHK